MDFIDEELLNSVFNYRVYTNEEKAQIEIDWSKLQFNELYKSYEFYESKFPKGYQNIVGFDKIIEAMAMNSLNNSPLKELENKLEFNNILNE